MAFSLEWLLNIRRTELSSIEMELSSINNSISDNLDQQDSNNKSISNFQTQLYKSCEAWQICSLVRSIENLENLNLKLKDNLTYLTKDKEMILNRYNTKLVEIKLLEKSKSKFLAEEQLVKNKKELSYINELALLVGKEN